MSHEPQDTVSPKRKPLWKSKSMLLAAAMTLVGLVMWLREPARPGTGSQAPPSGTPAMGNSLVSPSPSPTGAPPALQPTSPVLFRLGISYIGGFFLGWFCRKSFKTAMLLAGAAVVIIVVANHMGLMNLDWAALQEHVGQSLAWLKGEFGAIKQFVTGYLPSGAAGLVGLFMGLRRG